MKMSEISLLNKDGRSNFFEKFGTILILIGMALILFFLKEDFMSYKNITNIIRQQTPIMIMAIGVTLTIISGGIDVSGGAVIAFCSVVVATMAHPAGHVSGIGPFPLIVPILAGIIVGAVCGFLNGLSISYGNVPPFIATLGMMSVARGGALIISNGKPINGFTEPFNYIGGGELFGVLPFPIVILIVIFIVAMLLLHKTKFGVYVFAIGSNEVAAVVSGIKVKRIKTMVYTFAGIFTGCAAVVLTSRILAGQPAVGNGYEMDAITGAVIGGASFSGGIGTIFGTIIGALIMGVLTNGMTMLQITPAVQMIVKGAVIVGAVLLDERKHRRNRK